MKSLTCEKLNKILATKPSKLRRRQTGKFLRGPVPLAWLARAAAMPGKSLAVGLALWFEHGITGRKEIVAGRGLLSQLNVGRKAGYRAISSLEAAALVTVERRRGHCPRVKLCVVTGPGKVVLP